MVKSTGKSPSRKLKKPSKPYEGFPLYAHASRRWCKKILGRIVYFGPWADWKGALQRYNEEKDYLHKGQIPPSRTPKGLTIKDLINRFLTSKKLKMDAGELTPRSWADYHSTCLIMVQCFDKNRLASDVGPSDFRKLCSLLADRYGFVARANHIQRVRSLFKWGHLNDELPEQIRFGTDFVKPSKRTMRRHRQENGPRMLEAHEIIKLLDAAGPAMKPMILLAVNAGLGNSDIAELRFHHVDLVQGWLNFPRPKTGISRRCKLWPETVAALKVWIQRRPNPKDPGDAEKVFITKYGGPWMTARFTSKKDRETGDQEIKNIVPNDAVGKEFTKLLKELDLGKPKIGFYTLRHVHATIGGECRDQVAVDTTMGHTRDDMASVYRERITDDRLENVTGTIHKWLFSGPLSSGKESA
jgi:integrase